MKSLGTILILLSLSLCIKTGGKACTKNVQCGIPAADLAQSREVTDSLSGQCLCEWYSCIICRKGSCSCYDGFGCANCGARMLVDDMGEYTTIRK